MKLTYLAGAAWSLCLYTLVPFASANLQEIDGDLVGGYERRHSVSMPMTDANATRNATAVDFLRIKSFDGATFAFCLDTTASNANMCNLSGSAIKVTEDIYVYRDNDGSNACTVRFKLTEAKIVIESASGPCNQRYCGAGAEFVGAAFSRSMKLLNGRSCVSE